MTSGARHDIGSSLSLFESPSLYLCWVQHNTSLACCKSIKSNQIHNFTRDVLLTDDVETRVWTFRPGSQPDCDSTCMAMLFAVCYLAEKSPLPTSLRQKKKKKKDKLACWTESAPLMKSPVHSIVIILKSYSVNSGFVTGWHTIWLVSLIKI